MDVQGGGRGRISAPRGMVYWSHSNVSSFGGNPGTDTVRGKVAVAGNNEPHPRLLPDRHLDGPGKEPFPDQGVRRPDPQGLPPVGARIPGGAMPGQGFRAYLLLRA